MTTSIGVVDSHSGRRKRRWSEQHSTAETSTAVDASVLFERGCARAEAEASRVATAMDARTAAVEFPPRWELSPTPARSGAGELNRNMGRNLNRNRTGSLASQSASPSGSSARGGLPSLSSVLADAPGSDTGTLHSASHTSPQLHAPAAQSVGFSLYDGPGASPDEVSVSAAASFFRTYFAVIHPQYPFLDIKLCSDYYSAWRRSRPNNALTGWPAFFVKMIFALGSLIESKSDNAPAFKPQILKSTAQAEQSIMADSTSTPLARLQAMLLSAMFALHAENTWRIAHISGAVMKFATLHRFHRLERNPLDPANSMAIRVWSSAYVLDRTISSALGIPASVPDMYISSPLCEALLEPESPAPWLSDCEPSRDGSIEPDLRTFSYVCKIRTVTSFLVHEVEKDALDKSMPPELEQILLLKLREWEDSEDIERHSDGYQSSAWLKHIGHLTRLSICFVNRDNIMSPTADMALRAGCDCCTSFRDIQKKKKIAQPWLVILSQFRAAVTLWYIVWARAILVPREVNDALRDCSAVLAIFAEKWPKAEQYRDCFEYLAAAIPRCEPLGCIAADTRHGLRALVVRLEETGIHRSIARMLWEMCSDEYNTVRTL